MEKAVLGSGLFYSEHDVEESASRHSQFFGKMAIVRRDPEVLVAEAPARSGRFRQSGPADAMCIRVNHVIGPTA